jgi:hypothetical protein
MVMMDDKIEVADADEIHEDELVLKIEPSERRFSVCQMVSG